MHMIYMQDSSSLNLCAACGVEISCTADETCWCMQEILVNKEKYIALEKKYAGCLCQVCFRNEAEMPDLPHEAEKCERLSR